MKIVMANKYYFQRDGSTTSFFDMKRILESHGHEVIPFCIRYPENEPTPYAKYFVSPSKFRYRGPFLSLLTEPLNALKGFFTMLYSFEAKKKFGRLLDDVKPDIVHVHNIYHQISPSILDAARARKIPVVQTVHDYKLICPNYKLFANGKIDEGCRGGNFLHDAFNHSIQGSVIKGLADCVEMYAHRWSGIYEKNIVAWIAPSAFVKNKLVEFGMDALRITVIPHSIDCSVIAPSTTFGKSIAYVGRLSEEKGVDVLLRAMRDIDCRLVIVGTGPEEVRLKALARELGVNNRIDWVGLKTHKEVLEIIKTAVAVCVPSVWYEVFGYTALEALACGTPVIASDIGALPELLRDSKGALLVQLGDPRALAEAIQSLQNDPTKRNEMGVSGRLYASSHFTEEAFYKNLITIYNNALKSNDLT